MTYITNPNKPRIKTTLVLDVIIIVLFIPKYEQRDVDVDVRSEDQCDVLRIQYISMYIRLCQQWSTCVITELASLA